MMKRKQKNQNEKGTSKDYQSIYLRKTVFLARNGKSVYIDEEFHRNITHIIFMLGEGKINISDYLHNILEEHFKEYTGQIKDIYNSKPKSIL